MVDQATKAGLSRVATALDLFCEFGNLIELTRGDRHGQLVRLVICEGESHTIDPQEDDGGRQGQWLVPVHQCMVARKRVQKGGGLLLKAGIGIAPEYGGLRTCQGRLQQPVIP